MIILDNTVMLHYQQNYNTYIQTHIHMNIYIYIYIYVYTYIYTYIYIYIHTHTYGICGTCVSKHTFILTPSLYHIRLYNYVI